jgi:hypothetical protein
MTWLILLLFQGDPSWYLYPLEYATKTECLTALSENALLFTDAARELGRQVRASCVSTDIPALRDIFGVAL